MKTRVALLATSLLVTGGIGAASTASAKPAKAKAVKPVCNLVQDAKGDAGANNIPGADGDDIVSADVASDATTLTGVIRLAALQANDPQAPFGRNYSVLFTA